MDTSKPAFPAPDYIIQGDLHKEGVRRLGNTRGMTLKEYYQAHILSGIVNMAVRDLSPEEFKNEHIKAICDLTAMLAEEMIRRDDGKAN